MSSDGYFDGEDDIDSEALAEIDAIEAAHALPSKQTIQPLTSTDPKKGPPPPAKDDSFDDISLNVDESDLNKLDEFIKDVHPNSAAPVAGQRKFTRTPSSNMVQTTLFGGVVGQQSSGTNNTRSQIQRTTSTQRNPFGQQARKTKKWDQTAFAKTGSKQVKTKDKGKQRADDDEQLEEESVEFEQFPAPFVSST
jgi:ATP-dependent DNA helicase MPH1